MVELVLVKRIPTTSNFYKEVKEDDDLVKNMEFDEKEYHLSFYESKEKAEEWVEKHKNDKLIKREKISIAICPKEYQYLFDFDNNINPMERMEDINNSLDHFSFKYIPKYYFKLKEIPNNGNEYYERFIEALSTNEKPRTDVLMFEA